MGREEERGESLFLSPALRMVCIACFIVNIRKVNIGHYLLGVFLLPEVKSNTLLTVIQGDIRDVALLETAVQGVSLVIHTACIIDTRGLIDQQTLWDVNVRGKVG